MGNDNKVKTSKMTDEEKSQQIHKEVMLFLGDEVERIHHGTSDQSYNIEEEYAKSKKNHSPFSALMLIGCFLLVFGIAFFMTRIISSKNQEITVSLDEFEDLNLKNLLNTVTAAQTNYENAVKKRATIEGDMAVKMKAAEDARTNDIFVVDSMNLRSKKVYNQRIAEVEEKYRAAVAAVHEEFDAQLIQADREVEEYKKQLAEFDAAKIESAKEKEKAIDSERKVKELEQKKIKDQYEERIAELNKKLSDTQKRNSEDMRAAVSSVSAQYQSEIDKLDPVLTDKIAKDIIARTSTSFVQDFNGTSALTNRGVNSTKVSTAMDSYQKIFDDYFYLDKIVASIPQKNSIPSYVAASHKLVNSMSETFVNTTVSFYNETVELNGKINELDNKVNNLNNEINNLNNKINLINEKNRENLSSQQSFYEDMMENIMTVAKTSAVILRAEDYEKIEVYVAGKARYLITEEGADADFKQDKLTVKGKIFKQEDDTYKFVVSEDKNGNIPEIQFDLLTSGTPVRILSK